MNDEGYKFVNFEKHCELCKHYKLVETENPCNQCLAEPVNLYTEKPVYFEETKNRKKENRR